MAASSLARLSSTPTLGSLFPSRSFAHLDSLKDLKLKCDYAQDHLNANATLTSKGVVSASGVFGFGGFAACMMCSHCSKFLFGSLIDYDTGKGVVASSKFAVGFSESDFQVVSSM